jgi:hypothetical protein
MSKPAWGMLLAVPVLSLSSCSLHRPHPGPPAALPPLESLNTPIDPVEAPVHRNLPLIREIPPLTASHLLNSQVLKPPAHARRRRHADKTAATRSEEPPAPMPAPAPAETNAAEAIGTLTSGDSGSREDKQEVSGIIDQTEKGADGLKGRLSDPDKATVAQVHKLLAQARQALAGGDVDGARTLATKARVLLGELTQ